MMWRQSVTPSSSSYPILLSIRNNESLKVNANEARVIFSKSRLNYEKATFSVRKWNIRVFFSFSTYENMQQAKVEFKKIRE